MGTLGRQGTLGPSPVTVAGGSGKGSPNAQRKFLRFVFYLTFFCTPNPKQSCDTVEAGDSSSNGVWSLNSEGGNIPLQEDSMNSCCLLLTVYLLLHPISRHSSKKYAARGGKYRVS